jgi:hypothetical protein
VVPGTADGVIDDESVGERTTVVAACGADRVDVIPAAHDDDRFAVDVTAQRHPVDERVHRNAGREIGTLEMLGL